MEFFLSQYAFPISAEPEMLMFEEELHSLPQQVLKRACQNAA
jgi:hypothetical protein